MTSASPTPVPIPGPGTTPGQPTVLITGASGGLGRALCNEFHTAGWRVIAAGRSVPEEGPWHARVVLDQGRVESIRAAFRAADAHGPHLDLLVNNAGIVRDALLTAMSEPEWDEVLDVDLKGVAFCCQEAATRMIPRGEGAIINVTSFAARNGHRGQSNYVAAKAGLVGLTQSLARELGNANIRVNAVMPGVMPTKMTGHLTPAQLESMAEANALRRLNDPAEVAAFIRFLAGMRNVSGQIFQLDSRIAPWT